MIVPGSLARINTHYVWSKNLLKEPKVGLLYVESILPRDVMLVISAKSVFEHSDQHGYAVFKTYYFVFVHPNRSGWVSDFGIERFH